jgi:hypothetical protein
MGLAAALESADDAEIALITALLQGMSTTGQMTVVRDEVDSEDCLTTRQGEETHGLLCEKLDSGFERP